MFTVVKKLEFCAGHRLLNHSGQCASIHGHNYTVHLHVSAEELDEQGMVIDFSELKALFKSWIDENWDHGFLYSKDDIAVREALSSIPESKLFELENNPTAENMARYLLESVGPKLLDGYRAELVRVVLWETPNSFVEVAL